jgi:hypothetical protein
MGMKKKPSCWRMLRNLIILLIVLVIVGANGLAWMQAWSMTHFAAPGEHMPAIEALSFAERLHLAAAGVPVPRPENHHTPADAGYPYDAHRITLPHQA